MKRLIHFGLLMFFACNGRKSNNLIPSKGDCFWEVMETHCDINEFTGNTTYSFNRLKVDSPLTEAFIQVCKVKHLDYKVSSDSTFMVSAFQVRNIESMHMYFSGCFKYDSTLTK
jgi:hypothetical protein